MEPGSALPSAAHWICEEIGPRLVGGVYASGYWGDSYTVEDIWVPEDESQWGMRVRWSDGHRTVHCTAWNERKDMILRQPQGA